MFILSLIVVFAAANTPPTTHNIGTFEHYGQCLQAEAAMSESLEADERNTEYRTFYRCLPVPEAEKKERAHEPGTVR